jgi:hypothetical protein
MPSEWRSTCDDYEENAFFSNEKEPFILLLLLFTIAISCITGSFQGCGTRS